MTIRPVTARLAVHVRAMAMTGAVLGIAVGIADRREEAGA